VESTPKFSLIICTYMRANALLNLLHSVKSQTVYPNEILIIDGSLNEDTKNALQHNPFENLNYFLVDVKDRGLTRQRNFGIANVAEWSEIVCFLDDDTILNEAYFAELIKTYQLHPDALGVGGYITNESKWEKAPENYTPNSNEFCFDGWKRSEGSRFILRKKLGLDSNKPPCFMPDFSHGRSVSFLPPSGKVYEAEQLMGGVSSFKKTVFENLQFSTYFEGYSLYEDADFTLRLSKMGKLYLNTNAALGHFHDASGRPNHYKYGKMVVRNGWYVWRVKYPNPTFKARMKWNAIALLLTIIRFSNTFTSKQKNAAFTESLGRFSGWFSLLFHKPKIQNV
jgi:glycosyltransferase involved in cell wall biosynthesis